VQKPLRVAALLNAAAGTIQRQGKGGLRDVLTSAFSQHGILATLQFPTAGELKSAAEQALRQVSNGELDAIVVGGGDGSIRTVAGVLAGSGVPLGVIPLGTMNHFAKDLSIPLDPERAVAVIAAGHVLPVDIGEANREIFINNSSIGIYPHVVLERERRRRKHGLSKWVAMLLAGLRVLWHLPVFRLRIRIEEQAEPVRSPSVLIGNNAYNLSVPAFGRRERLDEGKLYLYVAEARTRLALFWLACRCLLGKVDEQHDLRILSAVTAEISTRRKRLLVAFDGEIRALRPPLHYRTRPQALRVFGPAPNGYPASNADAYDRSNL
jgi:diacylglycerol kinase family enzyme